MTNRGSRADRYQLSLLPGADCLSGGNWQASLSPSWSGTLAAGAEATIALRVLAPADAPYGARCSYSLRVMSIGQPNRSATVTVVAQVGPRLAAAPPPASGPPGGEVRQQLLLHDWAAALAEGWTVALRPGAWLSGMHTQLAADGSAQLQVTTVVPPGAAAGSRDRATIELVAPEGGVTAETVLTTEALAQHGLTLAASTLSGAAARGGAVQYRLLLTNTGNRSDSFGLQLSGQRWTTLAPAQIGPLAAGEGVEILVQVLIPHNTQQPEDSVSVRAFSMGEPGRSTAITLRSTLASGGERVYLPLLRATPGD